MTDYTPTTEEVRDRYMIDVYTFGRAAEFDRWLAAHDAEVRANERGHWLREMDKHRNACDYGEIGGYCLGYEDCDHYLPWVYYRMKDAAARGEDEK